MKVFSIGDLHLPGSHDKTMDIFGSKWNNHFERICDTWQEIVGKDDVVLIPGDISWAMKLEEAVEDLNSIAKLNGTKLIIKGNHDYWWNSLTKIRLLLPKGMSAIQNDSLSIGDFCFAGSRGWLCPGSSLFKEDDNKIYSREVIRMRLSLSSADGEKRIICMSHFPPFNEKRAPSGFTDLFEEFNVEHVVYAHLHDKACKGAFEGIKNGVCYRLVSCDHLDFKPVFITES